MSLKDDVLKAARADCIPEGRSGKWIVSKRKVANSLSVNWEGRMRHVIAGHYTTLLCATKARIGGVVVMIDDPSELDTHLNFMLRARGHVLITGLGLGCCLRGVLANPAVERVTVVEKSRDVIKLVWPHTKDPRVRLVNQDAIAWARQSKCHFDTGWHDLWDNPDHKDQALPLMHSKLLLHLSGRITQQGAWAFPREIKTGWSRQLANPLL